MMKKLLKNYLAVLALFVSVFSYAQVVTITELTRTFTEIQLGGQVNYTLKYMNTGVADVMGTTQMYIFGASTGGPSVSNNVSLTYEPTAVGTEKTLNFSVTFIDTPTVTKATNTTTIESSSDLATNITNGRYEARLFVTGAGFTWADVADHFTDVTDRALVRNNSATGYLGLELDVQSINTDVLSASDVTSQDLRVFVSNGYLNIIGAKTFNEYEIYNLTGASVTKGKTISNEINVSTLNSGIYLIKTDNNSITKFAIQK